MGNYLPVRQDWLRLHEEEVLEPSLSIVDAHHHFYDRPGWRYLADDYLADAGSGHRVRASVYMQALTRYRTAGPLAMQPVGETEYVVQAAQAVQRAGEGHAASGLAERLAERLAQGIVGYADLREGAAVREVLLAHMEAGQGRFRGVRHLATWDADSSLVNPLTAAPRGLLLDAAYRQGVAQLAPLGLSFDAWLLFPQLPELLDLALAFPQTAVIINHCGGVARIGAYEGRHAEVFERWKTSMQALARLPNVYVKLGGLGMRINGFGFEKADRPPASAQLAAAWRPWMETCIEAFGADRCMFESNFPVDKGSFSYATCWNAFKRLAAGASAAERRSLFEGTASRVYRLGPPQPE